MQGLVSTYNISMKKQHCTYFNASSSNSDSMKRQLLLGKRITKLFFCLLLMIKSQGPLTAQNTLDNIGLTSSAPASFAFSFRKLSTTYTGYAFQVCRSNDNSTQDIGFSGGDLDTAALKIFVGANTGYVRIWYDQSGNGNNLTQTTLSSQPRIVNAGVIDRENGKPFVRFFGTVSGAYKSLNLASDNAITAQVIAVNKFATGGAGFILGHTSVYNWHSNYPANSLFISYTSPSILNGSVFQNSRPIAPLSAIWNTTLMINSIAPSTPATLTTWNNIGSDRNFYHNTTGGGGYAELIVFSSGITSSERRSVEINQGDYYTISLPGSLNKNGKLSTVSSEHVDRNGSIGGSVLYETGESLSNQLPVLSGTTATSSITSASAASGGNLTFDGGAASVTAGVCWSTSSSPTTSNFKTTDAGTTGSYTSNLTSLTGSTTYYVRAYATNSVGTVYGAEQSFTTLAPVLPTLATNSASVITGNTATSGGNVTIDGGTIVTARGVCWSTIFNPTISDSKTTDAGTTGIFTSSITGLSYGTLYYVRAYATNSVGTAYGAGVSFTSLALPSLAATVDASSITSVSATSGSNVISDGGATITARGICWSTSTTPTTALSTKTTDGTGMGSYTSNITALAGSTTYYVRAYATNSVGTTYGTEVNFTTLAPVLPTLAATTAASSITSTSAVSGGSVTSDGGAAITVGVCWNTSTNPTTSDSKTTAVGALGIFTANITGLTLGTTYYVRAYATNSVGTVYGTTEISFIALGVGGSYQGGIIAYIFVNGDAGYVSGQTHGLISAAANTGINKVWGCFGTSITGADGTAIGTGNQNTIDIMAGCATAGIAARLCGDLILNTYTDWYLPSKDELNQLYLNRVAIGGFTATYYVSSTEYSSTAPWSQSFSNGTQVTNRSKTTSLYVRAVRTF